MIAVALALAFALAFAAAALLGVRPRGLCAFALGCAFVCAAWGALDFAAPRVPSRFPLRFDQASGAPAITVREESATCGYATDRALACVALAFALPLGALVYFRRRRLRALRLRAPHALAIACAAPLAVTLYGALASPPRGFDALWYHLPAAVAFGRTRALDPPGRDLVFYFPANVELLARALLDLSPRALALIQWPFALASAAAASALARAIGFRRAARFAAPLVLACPLVAFQSQLAYVDVATLFFVTLAAVLFVRASRAPRLAAAAAHAACGGLSLGVALGAKYAALPLAAAAIVPFGLWACAPSGRLTSRALPRAALLVALAFALAAVPSWFWYARNLHLTGNPLFPIAVPSLGLRGLFTSRAFNAGKELDFVSARWQWAAYPWIERLSHESGLGAAVAASLPAGLAVLLVSFARALRRQRLPAFGLPLAWGALYLASWWLGTPHEARHLLPLLPLVSVPCLGLCDLLARRPRARAHVEAALTVALALSSLVVLRALLFSPDPDLSSRPRTREALYGLPPALDQAVPEGATVANAAGRTWNYPLLGPRLDRRLRDFAPGPPRPADLAWDGADFVVTRGASAAPFGPPLVRGRVPTPPLWEGSPGEDLALHRVK